MTQNAAYSRREDAHLYKLVDIRAPRRRVRRCDRERATRRRTSPRIARKNQRFCRKRLSSSKRLSSKNQTANQGADFVGLEAESSDPSRMERYFGAKVRVFWRHELNHHSTPTSTPTRFDTHKHFDTHPLVPRHLSWHDSSSRRSSRHRSSHLPPLLRRGRMGLAT